MAGIYNADIFCDACIEDIKDKLYLDDPNHNAYSCREDWEEAQGYDDECNYDSDEYPKYCGDDEESDCPQHCGSHEDCLDATVMPDGTKIGYFFGNDLTTDGAEYVKEAVKEDRELGDNDSVACLIWAPYYDYIDYGPEDHCTNCGEYETLNEDGECNECTNVEEF